VLERKAIYWDADTLGADFHVEDVPVELVAATDAARERAVEAAADADEALMARYLHGDPIPADQLKKALREATLQLRAVPVLCGSAFKNKGVQPLLDAVVAYLPSPLDVPPVEGTDLKTEKPATRRASDDEPFSALVFKLMSDKHVGHLTYLRVYSGTMKTGDQVLNVRRDRKERVGRLLQMHANKRQEIADAAAGDIIAAVGFKSVSTGDTLCDPRHPIALEAMQFPEPVISIAIEPKTQADMDRLGDSLDRLAQEDPSFRVATDPRRARRSSRAWASCTSRSSATA
jgi:elongation factor G